MEDGKITKIALLIVTMLIITISSVISTGVMYIMLEEERNKNNNLNNYIDYSSEESEYNIEGTYTYFIPNSELVSYEFSDGKVKYGALNTKEGIYEIIDDKIQITYETATDPDGNPIDEFETEEELTIIDDYTLESESEVDGEVYITQYTKDEDSVDTNEDVENIE